MGTNNEHYDPSADQAKLPSFAPRRRVNLIRWRNILRPLRRRGGGIKALRFWYGVVYDAVMRFLQDDGWAIASYIALSILTSLFPFLIFVTALAGFFGTKSLADEAVNLVLQTWPQQVAAPIANEIHSVLTHTRSGLLTIGVILAIYFSSSGVEAIRIGLNRAYGVVEMRAWWLLRLESIAYVFVGALSLLTLALLVVFAPLLWSVLLHFAPNFEPLDRLVTFSRFAIASAVLLMALVLAHKFLPCGQRSFVSMAPGIVLTIVMWIAASIAFGSYLAEFARNYVTTYAGLASVMIALVFLYLIAAIFIFGGELNAAIMRAKSARAHPKPPAL
ncbi:MAG TPA: YihY/virulence factor BrkB family protein [Methylocella sp.]|jgi:membrane protein